MSESFSVQVLMPPINALLDVLMPCSGEECASGPRAGLLMSLAAPIVGPAMSLYSMFAH